jgi:hypothetical protein
MNNRIRNPCFVLGGMKTPLGTGTTGCPRVSGNLANTVRTSIDVAVRVRQVTCARMDMVAGGPDSDDASGWHLSAREGRRGRWSK